MIIGGMPCVMESVWLGGHLGVYRSYRLRERGSKLSGEYLGQRAHGKRQRNTVTERRILYLKQKS